MLHCPRCTYPLEVHEYEEIYIDTCHRCSGTLCHEGVAGARYGELVNPARWRGHADTQNLGPQAELDCPYDHGPMTGYRVKSITETVEIDLCETCNCLWLDKGEGDKLQRIVHHAAEAQEAEEHQEKSGTKITTYLFQLLTSAPVEVWNPRRSKPRATIALIFAFSAVFVYQLLLAGKQVLLAREFANTWGMIPQQVFVGEQIWTLATHGFLHGGLLHFGLNVYFFYIFGDNIEDVFGSGKFVLLFLTAVVAGGLLHGLMFQSSSITLVGASGGISGMMGAYLLLFPRVKVWIVLAFIRFKVPIVWFMGIWLITQVAHSAMVVQGINTKPVAWFAHLGGFIVGAGIVLLLGREKLLAKAGFRDPVVPRKVTN